MKADIEISQEYNMKHILEIGGDMGLSSAHLDLYGNYKAKINEKGMALADKHKNNKGKLVLVTATNPTRYGEGKTTVSIGLSQAFNRIGKTSVVALREPSLAPCFGVKGGATGGGYSQVVPMDDINLHFTGDIHAVGSAQNILCAMLDNHIHQGNELNVDIHNINIKRAVDISDRMLRDITIGLGGKLNGSPREDGFELTVACEIMAILCLSETHKDLEDRINKMIIAYSKTGSPITTGDIKATGAIMALLKDALNPNLVQTLEGTPAIIHGAPFANIAHGCSSVRGTRIAMSLSDIAVTEAGFGSDLGAEKFFNIKCRQADIMPDAVVIVTTIRAMKEQGSMEDGLLNLHRHISNIDNFCIPVVVAVNKFSTDTEEEISMVKDMCYDLGVRMATCECWEKGGKGAEELAYVVLNAMEKEESDLNFTYSDIDTPSQKLKKICQHVYGADDVFIEKQAQDKLLNYMLEGYGELPICMAKTPASFTDNPKILGAPRKFNITVRDVKLCAGAGFIVAYTGKVLTMPSLPMSPSAERISLINGKIRGLS